MLGDIYKHIPDHRLVIDTNCDSMSTFVSMVSKTFTLCLVSQRSPLAVSSCSGTTMLL